MLDKNKKVLGVEGTWSPDDGESKVTIHRDPSTGNLVGRISWLKDETVHDQLDFRNPRRELRGRKLLGLPILTNFKEAEEEAHSCRTFHKGQIYDPHRGWNIQGNLRLNESGDKLRVKGWVGLGPLKVSRSYTWTKIQAAP